MFCHNCGSELSTGAKFCSECASPVETKSKPAPQDAQLEREVTGGREAQELNAGGKSKRPKKRLSRKIKGLVFVSAVLVVGSLVLEDRFPEAEQLSTPAASVSPEATKEVVVWPESLDEITGLPVAELEFGEVCTLVSERIIGLSMFESPESRLETLNDLDGAYEAADFVSENAWVSAAATTSPNSLLENIADEKLDLYLISSELPEWRAMNTENSALFGRLSGEVRRAILRNCDLENGYENASALALKAKTTLSQAATVPWYPEEFNPYFGNPNVAWKWVKGRSCTYSSAICWHIDLITKAGADYVYVEISIEDSSGSYVDYSNDTARNLSPGQVAKLEFSSFSRGPLTGRIAEINVR